MIIELISRAVTNKLKILRFETSKTDFDYIIERYSFQYKGKEIKQPTIVISKGKAGRSKEQQLELELNALIKKAIDKGYKRLINPLNSYTEQELQDIVGTKLTNADGNLKPMLAKQADKITNKKVFDKKYHISRKINGVRCLIFMDTNGEIHTSSRGAINYDIAINHIIWNSQLEDFLRSHPNVILDGEIYKHGMNLNDISGLCRQRETLGKGKDLEFYWYDIVNTEQTAEERIKRLQEYGKELNLSFDPFRIWDKDDLKIQLVPQESISGYDNIIKKHDQFVLEGWEGAVIRLDSAYYGINARTNDMIKIKKYDTISCKVVGIEQGLREYDDMVFICKMPDSDKVFKAKPMGNHDLKVEYTENFNSDYLGHMADIKYFNYSAHGVVEQPTLTVFRWDLD